MTRYYIVMRDRKGAVWLVVDKRERSRFGRKSIAEQFKSRDKARSRARQLNAEAAAAIAGSNAELHTQ